MPTTTLKDRALGSSALHQGAVVGGRFVVKRLIAEGGMGRVYLAEQLPMGRKVALKVMRSDLTSSEAAVKRFFREAVAIAKLQHPNTITLIDYGESDEGQLFIAMEYIEGLSLKDLLAVEGRLSVERAARILVQIGLSLAEAHRKGIIHRDLKPDNVFIADVDGRPDFVKVIDFGIARLRYADNESRITQAGFVCGTPEYMSPEQARGEEIDARSDLYALGVMMFEMIEGRLPFCGDTPLATVLQHQNEPVPEMSADQPGDIARFVNRLLAKERRDRPASAEEMLRQLKRALPRGVHLSDVDIAQRVSGTRDTVPAAEIPVADTVDTEDLARSFGASRGRRTGRWLALAAVLALVIGGVWWLVAADRTGGLDSPDSGAGSSSGTGGGGPESPTPDRGAQTPPELAALDGSGAGGEAPGDAEVESPSPVSEPEARAVVRLGVASDPSDASLHVANRYVGLTPIEGIELEVGRPVELRLMLEGYEELREQIEVTPDLDGQMLGPFSLVPSPARVLVESEPNGAEVIRAEDGERLGETPLEVEMPRSTEPVELTLRRSRYQTARVSITPDRPEVAVHVDLEREPREPSQEPEDGDGEGGYRSPFGDPVD